MEYTNLYKVGDFLIIIKDAILKENNGTIGKVEMIIRDRYYLKVIRWGIGSRYEFGDDYWVDGDDKVKLVDRNEVILELL